MNLVGSKRKEVYKKYKHGRYVFTYELLYKNGQYHAISEALDGKDIAFSHRLEQEAIKLICSHFKRIVEDGSIREVLKDNHDIRISAPPLLKFLKDGHIGYHVAKEKHHSSIMEKGLIPSGTLYPPVDLASKEIDKYKPAWIPEWVKKRNALYFYPDLHNEWFYSGSEEEAYLYAVSLKGKKGWLGSLDLSGFALFLEDFVPNEEARLKHIEEIKNDYGPSYWKYSCSMEDYIKGGSRVKKKENAYGLSEVLIFEPIPKAEVFEIGYWNKEGMFIEGPHFSKFVREEVKHCYKELLQLYLY
ncbi:hypothetical protein U8V72_21075 [Priestia filamentosa]|uniref:hypothetical protein n=1 Tax=Priestia filamentosa TaxID=1402861 RepID=UPI00397C7557